MLSHNTLNAFDFYNLSHWQNWSHKAASVKLAPHSKDAPGSASRQPCHPDVSLVIVFFISQAIAKGCLSLK